MLSSWTSTTRNIEPVNIFGALDSALKLLRRTNLKKDLKEPHPAVREVTELMAV